MLNAPCSDVNYPKLDSRSRLLVVGIDASIPTFCFSYGTPLPIQLISIKILIMNSRSSSTGDQSKGKFNENGKKGK